MEFLLYPEVRRVIESLLARVPDSVVDVTETAMTTGARLEPYRN
jgi:hypothetical protein